MSDSEKLNSFILKIGGEIKDPTNDFEICRFVIQGQTGVIYKGKRGISFSNALAKKVYFNFENNNFSYLGQKKKRSKYKTIKDEIIRRDGLVCFYTLEKIKKEDASVEHLIPISKGGTNNIDNMVICEKKINMKLGNESLLNKLKFREKNLLKRKSWFYKKMKQIINILNWRKG